MEHSSIEWVEPRFKDDTSLSSASAANVTLSTLQRDLHSGIADGAPIEARIDRDWLKAVPALNRVLADQHRFAARRRLAAIVECG
jgi:hypothetical protein